MIATLEEAADQLTFTTFDFPRAASAEELREVGSNKGNNLAVDYQDFLSVKINELNEDEILIVTGSLYFLSEAKPYIVNVLKNK